MVEGSETGDSYLWILWLLLQILYFSQTNSHVGSLPHIRRHLQEKKHNSEASVLGEMGAVGVKNGLISRLSTGFHWVTRGITTTIMGMNAYQKKVIVVINGKSFTAHQVNKSTF